MTVQEAYNALKTVLMFLITTVVLLISIVMYLDIKSRNPIPITNNPIVNNILIGFIIIMSILELYSMYRLLKLYYRMTR